MGVEKFTPAVGRWNGRRRKTLCGKLRDDFDHLIDVDELYPRLQVLLVVMPNERRLLGSAKESARALVMFLH